MKTQIYKSISNIAWNTENNEKVYSLMKKYGFTGLEIAPTKIFSETPYEKLSEAKVWAEQLKNQYCFDVCSMQSIWFGKTEKLFGTSEEREILLNYTKRAIDFASVINCKNLVFGCPKNRIKQESDDEQIAIDFFKTLGDYAVQKGTVLSLEANPSIYGTNFINTTADAIKMVEKVCSKGFLLNLDVGTMIQNDENVNILREKVHLINHVHISEPFLKKIEKRDLHKEIFDILKAQNYKGFVSIEMGLTDALTQIENALAYVASL